MTDRESKSQRCPVLHSHILISLSLHIDYFTLIDSNGTDSPWTIKTTKIQDLSIIDYSLS